MNGDQSRSASQGTEEPVTSIEEKAWVIGPAHGSGRDYHRSAVRTPRARKRTERPARQFQYSKMAGYSPGLNGIVIGLLSSFGSAILILCIFLALYFFRYTASGRIFLDRIGRPGEYDDEQAFARDEAEALETMDDMQRTEYLRAKGTFFRPVSSGRFQMLTWRPTAFIAANPPESVQTDISLSQYLAIQEKGVSAWEFEPELEIANCFVEARTEIEFFDSECTVMSNLPVPKQNDVYYWEAKIFDKPENSLISIGMATKPYPLFRLPGKATLFLGLPPQGKAEN